MSINWLDREVQIGDIKFTPQNPRQITREGFDRLKDKIKRFGYHTPIKVQPDLTIIGGNMRVRVLMALGWKTVVVKVPDRPLTKAEYDELVVTDNLTDGDWEMDILGANYEIDQLEEWGFPSKLLEYDETQDAEKEAKAKKKAQQTKLDFCPHCGSALDDETPEA